jgi:hypothetical protein
VNANDSEPTIVRVTWDGGSRDSRPSRTGLLDAVHLDVVHPPASVSILNAESCEVIATAKLPSKTVLVSYGDAFDPSAFGKVELWDWDDPSEGLPPRTPPAPADDPAMTPRDGRLV